MSEQVALAVRVVAEVMALAVVRQQGLLEVQEIPHLLLHHKEMLVGQDKTVQIMEAEAVEVPEQQD
jgi:hypothetical protein